MTMISESWRTTKRLIAAASMSGVAGDRTHEGSWRHDGGTGVRWRALRLL